MSNTIPFKLNQWANFTRRLFPPPCLLCGAASSPGELCKGCEGDLPRLPEPGCPACALPTPGGEICGQCLTQPPAYAGTVSGLTYRWPADRLVQAFKYGARLAAGAVLAEQLALRAAVAPRPHLLIPVPLSAQRLAMRGFNPAHELAKGIGRRLDIPVRADACWRVRDTPPQTALPWRERRRNVKQAFVCTANLQGASVAVVDDVMTTGATVDALAQAILAAGAHQVSAWVAARTLPGGYR